jgi:hypothetical protein
MIHPQMTMVATAMTNPQAPIEQVSRSAVTLFDLASTSIRSSAVPSRMLRECYYQPQTRTLGLRFRTGGWEVYHDVDESVYEDVVSHPHPGYLFECLRQSEIGPPLSIFSPSRAVFIYSVKRKALINVGTTTQSVDGNAPLQGQGFRAP